MHIPKLFAVALIGLSFTASADFTTVIEAYEVATGDLTMPVNEGGTLKFKQCDECEWQTLLVTSSTHYVLNGVNVELNEFKQQLAGAGDRIVTVLHHLESNKITAVKIRL